MQDTIVELSQSDRDKLITLVANVRNLSDSQALFHKEMKESIKDLQNNYSSRLDAHETRINALETSKTRQNTMMSIGVAILSLLVTLLIYHITK